MKLLRSSGFYIASVIMFLIAVISTDLKTIIVSIGLMVVYATFGATEELSEGERK